MAYDTDRRRAGQAMTEFVVAILAIILILVATVDFAPVFLDNMGLLKEVREEAGLKAIAAESGVASADRREDFDFDIPGLLYDGKAARGTFSEKMYMPAANLPTVGFVYIPNIAGMTETLRYTNRNGTSEFVSGLLMMDVGQAMARARGAFAGAGWAPSEIAADDALVFTLGDSTAPTAGAAVHVGYADDGVSACLTAIARTAGGSL